LIKQKIEYTDGEHWIAEMRPQDQDVASEFWTMARFPQADVLGRVIGVIETRIVLQVDSIDDAFETLPTALAEVRRVVFRPKLLDAAGCPVLVNGDNCFKFRKRAVS
jgi:hypothetical protein